MKLPENVGKTAIVDTMHEGVIGRNAMRNKEIFVRKVLEGATFELVGEEYELTDRQVKNIVYKFLDIICAHIPN